jgi:hypothetical protein
VFDEKGRLLYFKDGRMFGVTAPIDGQPACHANGGTIGFSLGSAEAVRGWQDAAWPTAAPPSKTRPAPQHGRSPAVPGLPARSGWQQAVRRCM